MVDKKNEGMKLLKLKKSHQKVIDRQRRKKLVLTYHI
jgi:hypothetical protein